MPTPPTTHTKERKSKQPVNTTEAREDSRHKKKDSGADDTKNRKSKKQTFTPPTMSTASSASSTSDTTYYLVPNLQALDPSAREVDAAAHAWVQPTVIEDDDLTFGGKSLSAWYEEDRRRFSHSDGEEERRGRERVRRNYPDKSGRRK